MALSIGEKAQRILKFLLGLKHPRARSAMARYGFGRAEIEEGWRLLQALGYSRVERILTGAKDLSVIERLDAWENEWYPIISGALERHHPAVHERFFLNLSQTEGPEVAVSVQTMVVRLDEMENSEGIYGAEGPKARKLLESRGLTPAVVNEARTTLATLPDETPQANDMLSLEEEAAQNQAAEEAAWKWYREWSPVARVAVKNRTLLRQMGFLERTRGEAEEETPPPEGASAA
jgi:hypothetical protein